MDGMDGMDFPAFPRPVSRVHEYQDPEFAQQGMSLRDYFAAAIVPGLITAHGPGINAGAVWLAKTAYRIADAMLKAREVA